MKKTIQKIFIAIAICIFTLLFFGCNTFWVVSEIEDFEQFLAQLNRGEVNITSDVPQLKEFIPLIDARFDFGMSFTEGHYTFASIGGYNVIVSDYGVLYHSGNLLGRQIIYDKFVFELDGLKGVKSIFGVEVVPSHYSDIYILGNIVLAIKDNELADIFYGRNKVHSGLSGVQLFDNETLLINGMLYDLQLNPLVVNEYVIVSGRDELGFRIIYGNGLYGFVNIKTGDILYPKWQRVNGFNLFGYSNVNLISGEYAIINNLGEIIITETNGKLPVRFDGKFITFLDTNRGNLFGIANSNFVEVSNNRFIGIYRHKVWHDSIVIYNAPHIPHRFYLFDNYFIPKQYAKIQVFENHFIGKNLDGRYSFYDNNLEILLYDAEFIGFNERVLTVKYGGGTYYFRKDIE